jgi:hypothetical protein
MSEDQFQPDPERRRRDIRREDEEDRPRRRRPRREDEEDDDIARRIRKPSDPTGGLIPYRNPQALMAYYCGVFSLIPCLGILLGPVALILGFLGLGYVKKHETAGGTAHAIVGIVLGALTTLGHLAAVGIIIVLAFTK